GRDLGLLHQGRTLGRCRALGLGELHGVARHLLVVLDHLAGERLHVLALRLLQRQLACLDLGEAALRGVLEEIAVPAIASGPLGLLARHRRGNLGAGCLGPARGLSARSGLGECARGGEGRAERDEGNGWESFHVASLPRVRYANGRYPTPASAAPASNRSRIAADS